LDLEQGKKFAFKTSKIGSCVGTSGSKTIYLACSDTVEKFMFCVPFGREPEFQVGAFSGIIDRNSANQWILLLIGNVDIRSHVQPVPVHGVNWVFVIDNDRAFSIGSL